MTKKIKTTKNKISSGGLADKALLISVNISQWTGRKVDKRATDTANTTHKAGDNAGKYHKKLLPGAAELEAVATIASQARKYFYEQTLPWMTDGSRIISGKNYLNFTTEMRRLKGLFDAAVNDLDAAYPRLRKDAAAALGDLYDAEEYPDDIKSKFKLEANFLPLPSIGDFRTEISDNEKRAFVEKMKEVEAAAMRDVWTRLHSVVKAAADKLSQPDAIFRDSLLENITEIVNLMPMLNVSDDSALEKERREVQSLVAGLSADTLRENQGERDKASKALADIESRMGAFMGVSK